ncbi:MAG TPA: FG-GAP repeat protein, partial [Blastocatellia bacterium]|nr:FG-GAP repeat protein [Blastocatellia bacterium]
MRSSSSIIITRCRDIFISLLALAAIGWQQTPDGNRGTLGTARAVAHQNQQAVATQLALQQLTQQGSYDSLMEAFQAARSRIEPLETISIEAPRASNFASNPWQHFRAFFAADSVQVLPATADQSVARWRASLTGYGRQQSQQPVVTVEPVVRENRLEYVRGTLTEWYINDPRGLEQGFTLAEPPAAEDGQMGGFLVLTMAVESNLEPKPSPQGDSITFVSTDGEVRLRYSGLKAWDATGRQLPGRIEASEGKIALVVDDADAVYPVTVDPLIFSETKLTASDAAGGDLFGASVAISGETIVVGAPNGDTAAGFDSGSAYVFVRSGSVWSEQAKLTASDAAGGDLFGHRVAISGDTVVVGAPLDKNAAGFDFGSAYVFVRSGSVWSEQAKLTASDAAVEDEFGISVAISGETIVVGAPFGDTAAGFGSGSAYVFVRSGSVWSEQAKLTASDAAGGDEFGWSVAISGETIVVGALFGDTAAGPDSGSAYVFVRSGSVWSEQAKLTASGGDEFGWSVAISGETIVVGAPFGDTAAGPDSGSAYVFVRSGSVWSEQAKLIASDAAAGDHFGRSVAISGETIVVGAPSDDTAAGFDSGSAYVFVRSGSVWSEQAKLTASDAAEGDEF